MPYHKAGQRVKALYINSVVKPLQPCFVWVNCFVHKECGSYILYWVILAEYLA